MKTQEQAAEKKAAPARVMKRQIGLKKNAQSRIQKHTRAPVRAQKREQAPVRVQKHPQQGQGNVPVRIQRTEPGFLSEFFNTSLFPSKMPLMNPKFDLVETKTDLKVQAELPGLNEKDIDILLDGDVLTITGEKRHEREENKNGCYISESSCGSFCRSFTLPARVKESEIVSNFSKGKLCITLPKEEKAKPHDKYR